MRKDIFDRVCAFQKAFGPDYEGLSDEQRRFVEKEVVLGKRNGKEELRSCNEEKAFPPTVCTILPPLTRPPHG